MLGFPRGIVAKILWFPYLQYSLVDQSLQYLANHYFKDVDHVDSWLVLLREVSAASGIETVVSKLTSSLPQCRLCACRSTTEREIRARRA